MSESVDIKSILVVGGGTAGWMAASYLNQFLRASGGQVTLVESANAGTIGVGEATVPPLVRFVLNMGFDEDEFLRRCNATYKLGIRFSDWVEDAHQYWHPFGLCGGTIDGLDLFHFWTKRTRAGHDVGRYSSYSLQAMLCGQDLAPRPLDGTSDIIQNGAYAYHLDSDALAGFLRETAISAGVQHVFADVDQVVVGPNGHIDRIQTTSGRTLSADFYIDCTGFKGLIVEQGLQDPYIDWSHWLLCDRAVVMPVFAEAPINDSPDRARGFANPPAMSPPLSVPFPLPPYTQSTALKAGWAWEIPLSHRRGIGYVYSTAHIRDDEAARELLAHADEDGMSATEPRYLDMRVGRRSNFWVDNCVAVGLASGFVEPLESTGLFLIQYALELLMEHFPDRGFDVALRQNYNRRMAAMYDHVRDFILLHYLLSRRHDTGFWRASREVTLPESLQRLLELYDETGIIGEIPGDGVFAAPSYYHILSGAGRLPRRTLPLANMSDFTKVCNLMDRFREQHAETAKHLPSHHQLIQNLNGSA